MSDTGPGRAPDVALVLVTHSATLARGCAEVAEQMAPDVRILAVGGNPDGGIGTDTEAVRAALVQVIAEGLGAVVLTDLGSAVMAAELAVELLAPEAAARVRVVDGPFVEGAVAAAVAAQIGAALDEVAEAARGLAAVARPPDGPANPTPDGPASSPPDGPAVHSAAVTLRNPLGLHARPAAVLARMVAGFDAEVRVNGVNAASMLELMKLGASGGRELTVTATGPAAEQAVGAVVAAISAGFGEA